MISQDIHCPFILLCNKKHTDNILWICKVHENGQYNFNKIEATSILNLTELTHRCPLHVRLCSILQNQGDQGFTGLTYNGVPASYLVKKSWKDIVKKHPLKHLEFHDTSLEPNNEMYPFLDTTSSAYPTTR